MQITFLSNCNHTLLERHCLDAKLKHSLAGDLSCSAPSNELCVMIFSAIFPTNSIEEQVGDCHNWATFLASELSPIFTTFTKTLFHNGRSHRVLVSVRDTVHAPQGSGFSHSCPPSISVSWNRGSQSQLFEVTQSTHVPHSLHVRIQ